MAAGGGVEARHAVTAAALDVGEEPAVPGGQVRLAQIAPLSMVLKEGILAKLVTLPPLGKKKTY